MSQPAISFLALQPTRFRQRSHQRSPHRCLCHRGTCHRQPSPPQPLLSGVDQSRHSLHRPVLTLMTAARWSPSSSPLSSCSCAGCFRQPCIATASGGREASLLNGRRFRSTQHLPLLIRGAPTPCPSRVHPMARTSRRSRSTQCTARPRVQPARPRVRPRRRSRPLLRGTAPMAP